MFQTNLNLSHRRKELLIGNSSRIGGVVPGLLKNTDLSKQSINTYRLPLFSTCKQHTEGGFKEENSHG